MNLEYLGCFEVNIIAKIEKICSKKWNNLEFVEEDLIVYRIILLFLNLFLYNFNF